MVHIPLTSSGSHSELWYHLCLLLRCLLLGSIAITKTEPNNRRPCRNTILCLVLDKFTCPQASMKKLSYSVQFSLIKPSYYSGGSMSPLMTIKRRTVLQFHYVNQAMAGVAGQVSFKLSNSKNGSQLDCTFV